MYDNNVSTVQSRITLYCHLYLYLYKFIFVFISIEFIYSFWLLVYYGVCLVNREPSCWLLFLTKHTLK